MKSTADRSSERRRRKPKRVLKRAAGILSLVLVAGLAAAFYLSRPRPYPPGAIRDHTPDVANGKLLFTVGGCISCHKPPDGSRADKSLPSGGRPLHTPIGTVYPPNITPDVTTGIGGWSDADFVNAMQLGLAPDGRHLVPAFPYASYTHMKMEDVLDIKAYLMSLPAVASPPRAPDIPLIRLVRRGIGLWQLLGLDRSVTAAAPDRDAAWNRGNYLVRGPGHCGECHTPRNIFLVMRQDHWLAGAPLLEGKGKAPSLRDLIGRKRYKDAADLVLAFQWGEAFGYDKISSGGMASVQGNLSELPKSDLQAIATYLTSLN